MKLSAPPVPAYAVTPGLRAARPGADEEELEYDALMDAAAQPGLAAVAAADVDPGWVGEDEDRGLSAVALSEPLPLRRVVSFHVPDAQDGDLLWYDATEADVVVGLVTETG